jgi:hypothetical protein
LLLLGALLPYSVLQLNSDTCKIIREIVASTELCHGASDLLDQLLRVVVSTYSVEKPVNSKQFAGR